MAEQSDTPRILEELSKSNTAKSAARASRPQKMARRRVAIVILLFLPLLAGVLLVAYQQFSLQSQLTALVAENQQLGMSLATQDAQLQEINQQQLLAAEPLTIDDTVVRELETAVNQDIRQLGQQLAELRTQQVSVSEPSQQWRLLEAEYLIGMASQKLLLEKDISTAMALLEQADSALLASTSNNVFAARQAIAAELTSLRNTEALDREGIYLRLDNLLAQMEAIDLLNSMRESFESRRAGESQAVAIETDADGLFNSSLEFLGSIFVWRKWEEAPDAMLASGQEVLIKQNLRLMLEQAQLALLMRDGTLYRQSLAKGSSWFQRYAITDSVAGQSLLSEIEQLSSIDIDPPLPALNQSLTAISRLTASER